MGREFIELFDHWAESYDTTVGGHDEEYREVFSRYDEILDAVVKNSGMNVVEFGVGTGNLTQKLVENGKNVFGIEPSKAMREKAREKLPNNVMIVEGDFLQFPSPPFQPDTFVSTYAFHHLTDAEKEKAIELYGNYLNKGGKIVFADTVFENEKSYQETIEKAKQQGYYNLVKDLQTEYYTTIDKLQKMFEKHGFNAVFSRLNHYVWLIDATK
jgi:putative AdoMet-dependent methyltransferase